MGQYREQNNIRIVFNDNVKSCCQENPLYKRFAKLNIYI